MRLRRRLRLAMGFAAGLYSLERTFNVLPDDCMLVSYPRSGSTWLRFLLSNVRWADRGPTTFDNLNDRIPYALRPTEFQLKRLPRPRILKSHSAYDCQFRNVVLLVRDPRDIAVSYYHYHVRRGKIGADCTIDQYVPMYLRGEMDNYGTWGENVGSWLGARANTEQFMIVRYEDMKHDTASALRGITEFIGLATDEGTIQRAVHLSSPERMHPRKATPGEWCEVLSADSVDLIEQSWGHVMNQLGYALSFPSDLQPGSHQLRALAG